MSISVLPKEIASSWFVPPKQDGDDDSQKAQFHIKPLDGIQFADAYSLCDRKSDGEVLITPAARKLLLRDGLIGWKNIDDIPGVELEFSVSNMRRIEFVALLQITSEIFTVSLLNGEQEKN